MAAPIILYFGPAEPIPAGERVIAFDLDNTLMSRNVHRDHTNSEPYPHAVAYLRAQLAPRTGVPRPHIVLFSNQYGINSLMRAALTGAIGRLESAIGERVRVFVAPAYDRARKPFTGMYRALVRHHMEDTPRVDVPAIVYCGDAAGRSADFSDSDRKFAYNCGMDFVTPEVLFGIRKFGDDAERYQYVGFNPTGYLDRLALAPAVPPLGPRDMGMVILVGPPGCGKSTYCKRHLSGYHVVSRDELGTVDRCRTAAMVGLLGAGRVVIDATNPSANARREFLRIAATSRVPAYCVLFVTPIDLAQHLAGVRCYFGGRHIPAVAYRRYESAFDRPVVEEGFAEVLTVMPQLELDGKRRKVFEYLQ